MNGGLDNPNWKVISATVGAFMTFLPSIHETRRSDPSGRTAEDCRYGYAYAAGWSFLVGVVVASGDGDPAPAIAAWLLTAAAMVFFYESMIHSTVAVEEDA